MIFKSLKVRFLLLFMLVLTPQLFNFSQMRFVTSDKGLDFLANVAGLDIAHYNVQVKTMELGTEEKMVKYTFTSGDDKIDVLTTMREGKLVSCKLYPIEGSPTFTDATPTNSFIVSKSLLERLRIYFADSYIPTMTDEVLNLNVGQGGSFSRSAGTNVTVKLTVQNNIFDFMWSYTPNGIEDTYKIVVLSTEDGRFRSYGNSWGLYQIGNTDVNVNKEQAIQIAKEQAIEKFSLQPNQIRDEIAVAELSMQNRDNNTLYPHWNILLPLDKAYGAVGAIRVLLWADTGQISYIAGV